MADDKQWYNKQPSDKGPAPSGKRPSGKRPEGKRPEGRKKPGKRPAGKKPAAPKTASVKPPYPGAPMPANTNDKNGKPEAKVSANPAPKKGAKPALERKNGRLVPPVKPDPKKIKEQKKQAKAKKLAAENERKLKAEQAKIE
ncbi:MAG: hypothetical protein II641_07455, partial [Clostridiales bacterium]|nr:hypothetical protein [Clostridiales bacterium]